jgi:hypothetical protein
MARTRALSRDTCPDNEHESIQRDKPAIRARISFIEANDYGQRKGNTHKGRREMKPALSASAPPTNGMMALPDTPMPEIHPIALVTSHDGSTDAQ